MKLLRWGLFAVGTAVFVTFVALAYWSFSCVHQHCISAASMSLHSYADAHEGSFPASPKGFGDALVTLINEVDLAGPINLVEPGDDGLVYSDALASGQDVDERLCTRIYVQGLTDKMDGQIAILFDRDGCPGGDHFRKPWGPMVREVIYVSGANMDTIPNERWAAFAKAQVRLLVAAGVPKETAQSYYLLTGVPKGELGEDAWRRWAVALSPSLRVSKSPSLQVSKSPSLRVSKYPSLQVSKSPSLQVSKSSAKSAATFTTAAAFFQATGRNSPISFIAPRTPP